MNGGTIRNSDVAVFVSADSTAGVRCGDGSLFSVGIRYVDRAVLRQVYAAVGGDSSVIAVVADGDLRAILCLHRAAVGNGDASVFIDSHTAALRPGDDSLISVRRRDCDGGAVVGDLRAVFSDYRLAVCYGVAAGSVDSGYRRAAAYFRGESIICCPCSGIDGVLSVCIEIRKLAAGLPRSLFAQRVLLTVNNRDGD